ncbi:HAD family hydrolase [Nisaea acidiphila]|uniref:phosphoglycolate phosphatase n=1 Tax=Nisaea acidiphila TaxID=1862145 RepID=A0A9J7ASE4_9PROT|nr:HAD family hydrolase [Nisaea acidiphila]UUX50183.1 HAD family hydrolase [Nisaea acidiphila]
MSARPNAILFDWDSTLVDNWPGVTAAMNAALNAFDLPSWTETEMRARAKRSMRDNFPTIFGARWEEARDVFYKAFEERHLSALQALAGAEDLLSALRDRSMLLGVVSNKNGDFLRAEAEVLGWSGYFHRIVGATDAKKDKPAREPVDLALMDSGHSAGERVWFVGDSLVDLQCGIESGCTAVLIGDDPISEADLEKWPPAFHFADCDEMRRALTD